MLGLVLRGRQSRGGLLESDYFGDDTQRLLPATSENMSDSGNMDAVTN